MLVMFVLSESLKAAIRIEFKMAKYAVSWGG